MKILVTWEREKKFCVSDLNASSIWQNGPAWLKQPRSMWPLRSDFKKHDLSGLKKEFQVLQSVSNLSQLMATAEALYEDTYCVNADDKIIPVGNPEADVCSSSMSCASSASKCSFPKDDEKCDIANEVDFKKYRTWYVSIVMILS